MVAANISVQEIASSPVEGQATYGMANLMPEETGLNFVVFISQRGDAKHAARVKVSAGPKTMPDDMGSYGITPFRHHAGLRLSTHDERQLSQWVVRNQAVLEGYWDGSIAYTSQALRQLQPIL